MARGIAVSTLGRRVTGECPGPYAGADPGDGHASASETGDHLGQPRGMRADEVEQVAREQGVDGSPVSLRQPFERDDLQPPNTVLWKGEE